MLRDYLAGFTIDEIESQSERVRGLAVTDDAACWGDEVAVEGGFMTPRWWFRDRFMGGSVVGLNICRGKNTLLQS